MVVNVDLGKLNEDMYSVLMDKTNADAWLRVRAVDMGEGVVAYVKVYKWFVGIRGMGRSEKAWHITAPSTPRSEVDIADAVEKWLEGSRLFSGNRGYQISYKLKVTALRIFVVGGARDHYELWEEDYKEYTDDN